ncbi:protochlorophyllide reductase [Albimonas donghaensis]|uniref:Protochlorophyllide reductase n=1 Tax=Albimonas donghaensis TaxID=356660 RepID=A0A1H2QN70_9RHOB|nr:SDR family NAD(P)-dependent oxidoreductase [Albimonas donghaensis]SDW08104.1 protochlorophyllide reductase [Albimonas donghaensis]
MTCLHVLTGATSGLGLAAARRLAERTGDRILVGARAPDRAVALRAAVPADRLEILPLDTGSRRSVHAFVAEARARVRAGESGRGDVASVLCIAGAQALGPQEFTEDGIDAVFAANALGHVALVDGLRDLLAPGAAVVTTGSGTHDPANRLAARAGFRGAVYRDARAAALGRDSAGDDRAGDDEMGEEDGGRDALGRALDRYATSKLCAIYHAAAASGEPGFAGARLACFDPGLMPGTGLARDRGPTLRFAWRRVMPLLRHAVEGVSSAERSARALVDGLVLGGMTFASGDCVEFTGRPAPISAQAADRAAAARFLAEARTLWPAPPAMEAGPPSASPLPSAPRLRTG